MTFRTFKRLRPTGAYALMLAVAVGMFWLVRGYGETLPLPPSSDASPGGTAPGRTADTLAHLLVGLGVVLAAGRVLAAVFVWLRQPPVIGEVVAGILLGPSLLGRVGPGGPACLVPGRRGAPPGASSRSSA